MKFTGREPSCITTLPICFPAVWPDVTVCLADRRAQCTHFETKLMTAYMKSLAVATWHLVQCNNQLEEQQQQPFPQTASKTSVMNPPCHPCIREHCIAAFLVKLLYYPVAKTLASCYIWIPGHLYCERVKRRQLQCVCHVPSK